MLKRTGLLVLLILLICGDFAVAQSETREMEDVARQLVSPGWDEFTPQEDEPVILYLLRLVELRSDVSRVLEATVELSTERDPQRGYTILTDQMILNLLGEYPITFTGDFTGVLESSVSGTEYDAWLITMGDQSVSIELAQDRIGGSDGEDVLDQGLRIMLTPRQIYIKEAGILTDISVEYLTLTGALGKAKVTTQIGGEMGQPLALVIQDLVVNGQPSKRYFAMYATATCMASSSLPERGPLVPIGSIGGLQELFNAPKHPEEGWTKFAVGLAQLEGEVGVSAGLKSHKGKYMLYGKFDAFRSGYWYRVGGEWRFEQELGLAVHIDKKPDLDPAFRLGLCDEVHWGDLELKATYLPITLVGGEGLLTDKPWLHFSVAIDQVGWNLCYECTYDAGQVGHGIGVSKKLSEDIDLGLTWTRWPTGEDYYGISMVFWKK